MSWAVGFDTKWQRDIGYGVPAYCDFPGCMVEIDRGLANVCCGEEAYGGDNGCGLYFCGLHHPYTVRSQWGACSRCRNYRPPFSPTPDHPSWLEHKATDPSWEEWRREAAGLPLVDPATPRAAPTEAERGERNREMTFEDHSDLVCVRGYWKCRCGLVLGESGITPPDELPKRHSAHIWHAATAQRDEVRNENGAFTKRVFDEVLIPGECGVAGHFKFQENGGNCLLCQRSQAERNHLETRAIDAEKGQQTWHDIAESRDRDLATLRTQRDEEVSKLVGAASEAVFALSTRVDRTHPAYAGLRAALAPFLPPASGK